MLRPGPGPLPPGSVVKNGSNTRQDFGRSAVQLEVVAERGDVGGAERYAQPLVLLH